MSGEGVMSNIPASIAETLAEREAQYGSFSGSARIAQELKAVMANSPNWAGLKPDQREAMEMIASKLGRILNGYPDHIDSWHDMAGFSQLVANRLSHERRIIR